ncbi:MAG: NADP-dependent 3-hydroxy acid dehydrogenase YdfG, partial [Arenicella sp.]
MELKLDAKIVLITGGTGGIGEQICLDLIREKAVVVCAYRNETKFQKLKEKVKDCGLDVNRLKGYETNLFDQTSISKLIKSIITQHQRLD